MCMLQQKKQKKKSLKCLQSMKERASVACVSRLWDSIHSSQHYSSFYILLARSWVFESSAVNHLVQRGERRQDATLVGLHDPSVLDHLIQDDVDSIQVEHDLVVPSQRRKHTHRHTHGRFRADVTATIEGYVQFALWTEEMESDRKLSWVM